jgi:glycosyltransferase involved in cell wall biosynthesis
VTTSDQLRLGVVIPTHNRAALLERAVTSILAQTLDADEIIVVDDGSTDDTAAVVTSFGNALTYVRQENRGVAAARNEGVAQLSTPFVAFLDDDDIWSASHLERMSAAVRSTGGEAVLYFSDLELEGDAYGATAWRAARFRCLDPFELERDGTDWALLPRQPMTTQATVIRRDAYLECGGQAERLTTREDTHLFLKLSLGAPICAVSGVAGRLCADAAEDRLTSVHREDETYWKATEWLYTDILRRTPSLDSTARRELRARAAEAHLRLARIALTRHSPAAFSSLARGVRQDPVLAGRRIARFVTTSPAARRGAASS